ETMLLGTASQGHEEIWTKIMKQGIAGLSSVEQALFKKVESWDARFNAWNQKNSAWIRNGARGKAPAYPSNEPNQEEKDRYFLLLDKAEAVGIKKLTPQEQADWRAFNAPEAVGEMR